MDKVYLTGFGPFSGHEINPSEIIARKLRSYKFDFALDVDVFEVEYEKVRKFVTKRLQETDYKVIP